MGRAVSHGDCPLIFYACKQCQVGAATMQGHVALTHGFITSIIACRSGIDFEALSTRGIDRNAYATQEARNGICEDAATVAFRDVRQPGHALVCLGHSTDTSNFGGVGRIMAKVARAFY